MMIQRRQHGLIQQRLDHRMLEGGGQILGTRGFTALLHGVHGVDEGRFQPRKAEIIRAGGVRRGQPDCAGIALLGQLVQQRAARVGQMQHARSLVKGLARRVILRAAQQPVYAVILHHQDMAVPAAGHQADKGRGQLRMRKVIGADVPLDVIDRNQRLIRRIGQRLGAAHARQQRAYQTGAVGDADGVHIAQLHTGLV